MSAILRPCHLERLAATQLDLPQQGLSCWQTTEPDKNVYVNLCILLDLHPLYYSLHPK